MLGVGITNSLITKQLREHSELYIYVDPGMPHIIPILVPRNFTGVPSYTTTECALADSIKRTQFEFSIFELNTHNCARIKSLLKNFLRDGKLTREPARQTQQVGCIMIRIQCYESLE